MNYKKRTLVINLNEINLNFILKHAKLYKNKNILKFFKKKNLIKTKTADKIQHKNLDPWVQEVSINTGKPSTKHKIYNLGQVLDKSIDQIWDKISIKYKIFVWGSMNSQLRDKSNIKLFFPDPWNFTSKIKPKILKNLFLLPSYYAKNYSKVNILKFILYSIKFFKILLSNKFFYLNFGKNFVLYLKIFLFNFSGLNFKLFILFDILSLNTIHYYQNKLKPDVSFIFLNSIAHFQHNNWDEKKNYKNFFNLLDILFKDLINLEEKYQYSFVYNAFTQKKIKTEYLLKPIDPKFFLKKININFKKIEPNMTNGGIIFFKNKIQKKKYFNIMRNFEICSFKLFELQDINDFSFFYKIAIKTHSNVINYKNLKSSISYYKRKKIKKIDYKNIHLFNFFKFIKTTGAHVSNGILLTHNYKINKKVIKNHEIHEILRKFLNV